VTLFADATFTDSTFVVADDFGRRHGRADLDGQAVDFQEVGAGELRVTTAFIPPSPFDFLAGLAILASVSLCRTFEITFYASLNRFSNVQLRLPESIPSFVRCAIAHYSCHPPFGGTLRC
jgi:hypothetical protein